MVYDTVFYQWSTARKHHEFQYGSKLFFCDFRFLLQEPSNRNCIFIHIPSWKVPCSSEAGSWIIQILLWNYGQLGRSCDCDGSTCRTSDYSSFPGSQIASDEEINNNHNANAEDLNNFNSPSNPATIAKAEEEDWHQFEMNRHAIKTLLETHLQWH
mgnify:CR=1 FL=1